MLFRSRNANFAGFIPFSVDTFITPTKMSPLDDSWFIKEGNKVSLAGVWNVCPANLPILDACNVVVAQSNYASLLSQRGRVKNPNPLLRVVEHEYWVANPLSLPFRTLQFLLRTLIKVEAIPYVIYCPVFGVLPMMSPYTFALSTLIGSTSFLKYLYLVISYKRMTDKCVISLSLLTEVTLPSPTLTELDSNTYVKKRAAIQSQVQAMTGNISMIPQVQTVLMGLSAQGIEGGFLGNTTAMALARYAADDLLHTHNKVCQ